jgi:hypothetical protein
MIKLFRDIDGNPRVESELPFKVLGSFLSEDIQDSPAACREILEVITRLTRGELADWRRVGNAHVLSLSGDEAVIESLFGKGAKPCRLSLEVFRESVEGWLLFLDSPQSQSL